MSTKPNYTIVRANRDDVAQINDIVNYYIRTSAANWSWNDRTMDDAIQWYEAHQNPIHPLFVAKTSDGTVLGYSCLSVFRGRDGYKYVAENSVYCHPNYQGMGIGKMLMEAILEFGRESHLEVITAWIDSGNTASIDFHYRYGFELVGQMKDIGRKFDKVRSVTIMQLSVK